MPLRVLLARPRLLLAILVGLAVVALLPIYSEQFRGVTRILVGWDVGVALYLVLAFWMIAKGCYSAAVRFRPTCPKRRSI